MNPIALLIFGAILIPFIVAAGVYLHQGSIWGDGYMVVEKPGGAEMFLFDSSTEFEHPDEPWICKPHGCDSQRD